MDEEDLGSDSRKVIEYVVLLFVDTRTSTSMTGIRFPFTRTDLQTITDRLRTIDTLLLGQ